MHKRMITAGSCGKRRYPRKVALAILAGSVFLQAPRTVYAAQEQKTAEGAATEAVGDGNETDASKQSLGRVAGVAALTAEHFRTDAAGGAGGEENQANGSGQTDADGQADGEQEADSYDNIAIAQVTNYVNVRQEPTTESEIIGKLYDKSAATVLEATDNGWYYVESGSLTGYIHADYVVVGDEELAKSVSTQYATVETTTLFVRKGPSTEEKILTMLPEGQDYVITEEHDEQWVKVETDDGEGYISTDYISVSTEYKEAESREEEEARLAREREAQRKLEEANRQRETAERKSGSGAGAGSACGTASHGSSKGQEVVNYAKQFVGNPYVYGGSSLTNGADCSGFVMSVYAAFGVSLPHSSAALRGVGYGVSQSDIMPGDIVCYDGHVGIYVGNNTLLHASTPETGIKYTSPITYRPIVAVRRIF